MCRKSLLENITKLTMFKMNAAVVSGITMNTYILSIVRVEPIATKKDSK